jgi:hypothetical protein
VHWFTPPTSAVGGSDSDYGISIAVDGSGNVYLTGYTYSTDFPAQDPLQPSNAGLTDAFVTKIDPSGDALVYSTYLGGNNYDYGYGVAVDGSGNVYVTGYTSSDDFPIQDPIQPSIAGGFDAFVAKISPDIMLIGPNGGEVIPSGSTYAIQWLAPPEMVSFKLKFSTNNGKKWIPIDSGITETSYDWAVPTPPKNKTKCLVKVIGYDASGKKVGADKSDSTFTIEVVKLTSPNGGEILTSGESHSITWTTNETKKPVAKVVLKYKIGKNPWEKIETIKGSDPGTYSWTVPTVPEPKSTCLVKVVLKEAEGKKVGSDTSDGYFTIEPAP